MGKFNYKIYVHDTNQYVGCMRPLTLVDNESEALVHTMEFEPKRMRCELSETTITTLKAIDNAYYKYDYLIYRKYDTEPFLKISKINKTGFASDILIEDDQYSLFAINKLVNSFHQIICRIEDEYDLDSFVLAPEENKVPEPSYSKEREIKSAIDFIKNETVADIVSPLETLDDYIADSLLMDDLLEVKDYFDNMSKFSKLGVKIPTGILMNGPAGTGKSYAARCLAGSANAYFISTTASACQGMYVGSGAENLRKIFDGARKLAKKSGKGIILFFDEIDSFQKRGVDVHHTETTRTLNELLAQISGINPKDNIIVIGATNFVSNIDTALLRPGRLGKQISVNLPENKERIKIIKYYLSKVNLPLKNVTLYEIASMTEGMSPAGIAEIVNNAAIKAVRRGYDHITKDQINDAIDVIVTKGSKRPDSKSKDLKLVCAHESGHALAEILSFSSYPIKVSSYTYGNANGFTQTSTDSYAVDSKESFFKEVRVLLAGRAAEEIICGRVTTGASSDLARAKAIIKSYYEDFNFDPYKVNELPQIINDNLTKLYQETKEMLSEPNNLNYLNELTARLIDNRVLYKNDLKHIVRNVALN